jgi:hypothetical protein
LGERGALHQAGAVSLNAHPPAPSSRSIFATSTARARFRSRHRRAAARFCAASPGCRARPSPGWAIVTQGFKGAATRLPEEATAFGLRRDYLLIEIISRFADEPDKAEEELLWQGARATRHGFDAIALPGGYPNLSRQRRRPGPCRTKLRSQYGAAHQSRAPFTI